MEGGKEIGTLLCNIDYCNLYSHYELAVIVTEPNASVCLITLSFATLHMLGFTPSTLKLT